MNRLQQIAKSAMAAVDGDDLNAVKAIIRHKVDTDGTLRDQLIDWAINELVSREWGVGRAERRNTADVALELEPTYERPAFGPAPPSPSLLRGIQARVDDMKKRLMDWPMAPLSGKRLGQCAKPEIVDYAGKMKKNAATIALDSAWLLAVAGMLPDNKQLVKDVLREEDLTRLRRRVERQKAA